MSPGTSWPDPHGSIIHQKKGRSIQQELARLNAALIQESVLYFPVRHHSPACAWHLNRLVETHKPAAILIEGPESLNHFIPHLADPDLKAPVALYSQYVDHKGYTRTDPESEKMSKSAPSRFGAFYPLCDYSPELVAIRAGTRLKAKIAFCDLDFAIQKIVEHRLMDDSPAHAAVSMFDEQYLAQNRYLRELAQRTGCRDTNELWDRLFESEFCRQDTIGFMQKVAAYCFFARRNTPPEEIQRDGTLAREKRMSVIIRNELRRLKRRKADRPLLVVTGGFHTPSLVTGQAALKNVSLPAVELDDRDRLHAVIPYSYQQLDALNGYAAGMPSPGFYQRIWESAQKADRADLHHVSRDVLVQLSRKSREKNLPYPVSTADAIAANQMAGSLAHFRGNPGPMREDILDGVRASFTKGALDAEGDVVMALARDILCGNAVGFLPQHIRTHPLIEDFRSRAQKLGLRLDSTRRQPKALEIYKREKHRDISRFFRMLEFLDIPFARFAAGPDFIAGTELTLTVEHWEYNWSPLTESTLVDLSLKGATIGEVVLTRLRERREKIQNEKATAGSAEAVGLLLVSCRLGLHDIAKEFVPFVFDSIQAENTFETGIHACLHLDRLQQFKSPLETRQLAEIPQLLETAYRRSCFLLTNLATLPQNRQETALAALPECRELITAGHHTECLDVALFWHSVETVRAKSGLEPGLEGGLLGMCFSAGKCTTREVCRQIEAQASSRDENGNRLARFLNGLFSLCREATWNQTEIMAAISTIVSQWNDHEFYTQLPDMRLAFAAHTPQETDQVAGLVARILRTGESPDWYVRDLDEAFFARCTAVAARVVESLKEDCLTP